MKSNSVSLSYRHWMTWMPSDSKASIGSINEGSPIYAEQRPGGSGCVAVQSW